MALTAIGKSDLSTGMTDKESRIKGQPQQEEEKESSANLGKEQKQEEKVERFSLPAFDTSVDTRKVKKAAVQQEDAADKDESAEQRNSEDNPVDVTADNTTSTTLAMMNSSSQDPILLSRWVELAKSSASQTGDEPLSGSTAADGVEASVVTGGKTEVKTALFASLVGSESASEVESGVEPKEIGQQRLQTALLSRGISLSTVMEQTNSGKASVENLKASTESAKASVETLKASTESAKASVESIKTSTETRTQAVVTQSGSTTGNNLLSMAKTELSLSSTAATAPLISTADTSSTSMATSAVQLPVNSTQGHEWSPLKLSSSQSHWGQQLVDTLKERVEMQYSQSIKQAHIRLDPPELGKLDLTVRIDGDKLSVQLNASNPVVRDALLQSSDRLRTSLATEHSGGVEVNVGQGDSQRQQQGAKDEEAILAGRRNLMNSESDSAVVDMTGLNALV